VLLVFRGERASLFWTGLIVLGLASWVLFASIWSSMRTLLDLYFYSTDIAYNLPAIVSSAIFILIGFLMMKSGDKEKPAPVSPNKALISFRGEKTSVFWVGLNILCLASLIGFAEVWSWRSVETSVWFDLGFLLVDSIAPIVGAIIFILIGLYMMKSGVKKEAPPAEK
jgi:putative Mn2+ efflux pump MntP